MDVTRWSRAFGALVVGAALLGPGVLGASAAPLSADVEVAFMSRFQVDAASGLGRTMAVPLQAGRTYVFDVTGTFDYDVTRPGSTADAECSRAPADATWTANRHAALDPAGDVLDLYVNLTPLTWRPVGISGSCDPVGHHYRASYTAPQDARAVLSVRDVEYGDNRGALTVSVYALDVLATAP